MVIGIATFSLGMYLFIKKISSYRRNYEKTAKDEREVHELGVPAVEVVER